MSQTKQLTKPKTFSTENIETQLVEWAHQGSKESLEKIENFIATEKDENLLAYAKIARDECAYFYYDFYSDEEEKELLLCKLIVQEQDRLFEKEIKLQEIDFELEKLELEKKVHRKIMNSKKYSKNKEDWQYNFSDAYMQNVAWRLDQLKNEIEYLKVWIEEAKKSLKIEKYKTIPEEVLRHIHFDYENANIWNDEDKNCFDEDFD